MRLMSGCKTVTLNMSRNGWQNDLDRDDYATFLDEVRKRMGDA